MELTTPNLLVSKYTVIVREKRGSSEKCSLYIYISQKCFFKSKKIFLKYSGSLNFIYTLNHKNYIICHFLNHRIK